MAQLETRTEPMVVNFGPHHPSMHGVLRLVVTLDGENVIDCEPVIGYLHRGMEKIAENRTNVMYVPYVSRMDYAAGMFYEAIVVNAPERLANIPVPKRASYIRVLMLELNRIANHLLWLGPFLADVGAHTPFFYIFREREMIYDLWEAATGQRLINNNFFRIGGVACDLPYGWLEKCIDFCDWFGPKIDEYEKLIKNNTDAKKIFVEPNFQSKKYFNYALWKKKCKKNFFITKGPGASTLMGESEKNTSEICISDFAKEVLYENLLDIIPEGFNLKLEIIFPNGAFLAERTSNKSFGIVDGLSIIGTSAETYSSASPDQLEEAKAKLAKLIQNDFKGKVIFVIGENGLNLAKNCNLKFPIIKIGNWLGPLIVDAAIKKVNTVILFGYHGKLIKLAGGIFHTHNHLADGRIEILVYLAVQEKLTIEIKFELSLLDNLENALHLLERFNKSLANKLFKNLSNTIEKRSFAYVNRYVKTDMEIASIIFDRKRRN